MNKTSSQAPLRTFATNMTLAQEDAVTFSGNSHKLPTIKANDDDQTVDLP